MEAVTQSTLVLGTAQLGSWYGIANKTGQPDQKMATAIIGEAWQSGIREFDTAQGYGESETVLGNALAELGVSREAQIISKFHPNLDHLDQGVLSGSIDKSLKKLGVPCLSGILLHREEMLSIWDKGLGRILSNIASSRRVKHIGVSVYSPDKALEALNTDGIDIIQVPANILDRRFEEKGVFQLAVQKRKKIYIRSVFLQGLILMDPKDVPEKMQFALPVIAQIKALAAQIRLDRHELALGYLKEKFPQTHVIFGAESSEQVRRNISGWRRNIEMDLVALIEQEFDNIKESTMRPDLWPK